MAYFSFTKAIREGRPISLFNEGRMRRDFTYVDDIVEGVMRVADNPAAPDPAWSGESPDPGTSAAPYKIYNIGNNNPVSLLHFIEVLEGLLGKKATKALLPMQPGDIPATCADISELSNDMGFRPKISIEEGLAKFVGWYCEYYG